MSHPDPPYCEAYPCLSASQFRRAVVDPDTPLPLCRFAVRTGAERGWLIILGPIEGGYEATWRFSGPGLDSLVGLHKILYTVERGRPGRPSPFTCRRCKQRTANLYFKDFWGCRTCHGFRHRSTYLQRSVRDAERQTLRGLELRDRIGAGRPPKMRHATYAALKSELRRLERAVPNPYHSANAQRQTVIEAEWMNDQTARQIHGFNEVMIFGDWIAKRYWG